MAKSIWKVLLFILIAGVGLPHVLAGDGYPPQSIEKAQRCPVCGMYPANYPKWHAQIIFKDGSQAAFDSSAEMFRFVNDMHKYDKKHTATDIGNIYVQDYSNKGWLLGMSAFFVVGSKIMGPMGNDLPAFASENSALSYTKGAGGRVLRFDQIDRVVIDGLRNTMHNGTMSHIH